MLNYVKSEFYRIIHSPTLYVVGLCFIAAPLLLNIMLYCFTLYQPDFPYSTTSFSYSNIVANPMTFCFAALFLVFALYEGNEKNGNLKNVVTSGISRKKIFMGQIVVCLVVSVIILIITVSVYIFSAQFLLKVEGPVTAMDLVVESLAVTPIAVAALILSIVVSMIFEKSSIGIIYWLCIFVFVPQVLFYIGIKIDPIREIALWMPQNLFSGMQVNQSVCTPIWATQNGLSRCLISGFIGIAIFGIVGVFSSRKREL